MLQKDILTNSELSKLEQEVKQLLGDFEKERKEREKLKKENEQLQQQIESINKHGTLNKDEEKNDVLKLNKPSRIFSAPQGEVPNEVSKLPLDEDITKDMLADVLIEAQKMARKMTNEAKIEAEQMLINKRKQLNDMKQSIELYQEKMKEIQQTSNLLVEECLKKLEQFTSINM